MFRLIAPPRCLLALLLLAAVANAATADASVRLLRSNIDWRTSGDNVQFRLRFDNPDTAPSGPVSGELHSQEFGLFLPDAGLIGHFDVPSIAPRSFFDVFLDIPLSELPPNPPTSGEPPSDGSCPPQTHWDGNVDVIWSGAGGSGQVNAHFGDLIVCPGGGASLIHFRTLTCASPAGMSWSISGLCPGFSATLLNEDLTPAPNPAPAGWTGHISVTAAPGTAVPDTCCFQVTMFCDGVPGVIDLCAITCDCAPAPPGPVLGTIDWQTLPGTTTVQFHLQWVNPSATTPSSPVSGDLFSQEFGLFLPDAGLIGHFDVPPMQPSSFFDVFFEVPLADLPPNPPTSGEPPPGGPCPPQTHWDGNVDVIWGGPTGTGQVNAHFGDLIVCPGAGASLIHFRTLTCTSPAGMPWSISGLCPGFGATLLNEDMTPAPNPVPAGWTGYISVTAAPGTAIPDTCCFQVTMLCDGVPGVIDLCAITCPCAPAPSNPVLGTVGWETLPGTTTVQFHLQWVNPSATEPSSPITGTVHSQEFGVFLPDVGLIGDFTVPPLQPHSFFDVFIEVPLASLPPGPPEHGGPPPGSTCPTSTHWDGNVDIIWMGPAGGGQVNKHFGDLTVCAGSGASLIHVAALICPTSMPWSITGLCPGYSATLVEEDMITPAPNPVPAGWTGHIKVTASAAVGAPDTCCFQVTFQCEGVPGVIDMCAITCRCDATGSVPGAAETRFGIRSVLPNPAGGPATIAFSLPSAGRITLEIFDVTGQRVRVLADDHLDAGAHSITWDGRDSGGRAATAGIYFARLIAGPQSMSHKFVMSR